MTTSLRIAVADDEPDMREYFRKCLTRLGHQVVAVAANGQELIERCGVEHPDLVITDVRMPDMSGIDAARQVQGDRPVLVVLVSALADAVKGERVAADYVVGCLVKPIRKADLEPVIAQAVRRFEQSVALPTPPHPPA